MKVDDAALQTELYRAASVLSSDPSKTELFVKATSNLPLGKVKLWELAIRQDLDWGAQEPAAYKPAPSKWQFWKRWVQDAPPEIPKRSVTWVDLCHGNGYRREHALRELPLAVPNALLTLIVLRRLNDWVPQVRVAAVERVRNSFDKIAPEYACEALMEVLLTWNLWGRMEHDGKEAVMLLASRQDVSRLMLERVRRSPVGPMAELLSQLFRVATVDDSLLSVAQTAVQPKVRARAFSFLTEGKATWSVGRRWEWTRLQECKGRWESISESRPLRTTVDFEHCVALAARDRSHFVRAVAAEALIQKREQVGDWGNELALLLADDRSTMVSGRARYVLENLNG